MTLLIFLCNEYIEWHVTLIHPLYDFMKGNVSETSETMKPRDFGPLHSYYEIIMAP